MRSWPTNSASDNSLAQVGGPYPGGVGNPCPLLLIGIPKGSFRRNHLHIMSKIVSVPELNPSEDLLLKARGPFATISWRSSVALSEFDRKSSAGTSAPVALSDDGIAGDYGIARAAFGAAKSHLYLLGSQCAIDGGNYK